MHSNSIKKSNDLFQSFASGNSDDDDDTLLMDDNDSRT